MNKRKVIIGISNLKDMAKEYIDVWHQVESGKPPKNAPIERITFESEQLLFKTLTPRRHDLLKYIHQHGKITISMLAKKLNREYNNVFQDVKILRHAGLILKDNNKYYVPWDMIVTELPLTLMHSANETKHKRRKLQ